MTEIWVSHICIPCSVFFFILSCFVQICFNYFQMTCWLLDRFGHDPILTTSLILHCSVVSTRYVYVVILILLMFTWTQISHKFFSPFEIKFDWLIHVLCCFIYFSVLLCNFISNLISTIHVQDSRYYFVTVPMVFKNNTIAEVSMKYLKITININN